MDWFKFVLTIYLFSLFIIVSFIYILEIIGKDGKQKIGKNNKKKREFLNFTKFLIN